ncbi:MAG: hypothetical protein FJ148_19520 [Deltaproteobacteria bacterium]|nr:hypothetical protein [Deltaproteobacteria bacterium]
MEFAFQSAKALSIAAFLFYGLACLLFEGMNAEFERYGLARLRKLTGSLEVAGALGLCAGYFLPPLVIAASGGLSLLMLMGVLVRVRIRDPLVSMLPALALLVINAYVLGFAIHRASGP